MKKQILLVLIAVLAISFTVSAQNQPRQGNRQQVNPKERAEQMAKDLNLTDKQKQQVQTLFEEQQTKMQEIRQAGNTDQDARREEFRTLREEWNKSLEKIIGKENMEKHQKMVRERSAQNQNNRNQQRERQN